MQFSTNDLLADLTARTKIVLAKVEDMKRLSQDILTYKSDANNWNALECLKHLNLYSDFYSPEIENKIKHSTYPYHEYFRSGVLGNYFVRLMDPKPGHKKMKTLKDKNPIDNPLHLEEIEQFIVNQKQFLILLEQSKKCSLTKTKTSITFSTMIKLRLGDTLRFLTVHTERHILQAERAIAEAQNYE